MQRIDKQAINLNLGIDTQKINLEGSTLPLIRSYDEEGIIRFSEN